MTAPRRVAVVGGAGSFGRHLVEGLLARTDCHVIVCGRTQANAQACVDGLRTHTARLSVSTLNRELASAADIAALNAFCVVDAAGPFQQRSYAFAEAAIEAGAHYVDLADGREFVAGFGALDAPAKAHDVLAVTGASSTPALSHAVLDELTRGWTRIDDVEVSISPGFRAMPLGRSVVAAIFSYAGRPVRVRLHGSWRTAPGWGLAVRRRFADLGWRWLSLCETPDLDLIPLRFPFVRNAVFRAGIELPFLHFGMWVMSLAVRAGWMKSLVPLSEVARDAAVLFRPLGSDCGGMLVEVTGRYGDGARLKATWTLIAESGDGPVIPALPALGVVTALLEGRLTLRGAMPCVGILNLAALEAEFKRFAIRTHRETAALEDAPLFARVLAAFDRMPAAVRHVHAPDPAVDLQGRVDIEGPQTWAGRALAWLAGLPGRAAGAPASVTIERDGEDEIWIRRFGESGFASRLRAGAGKNRLCERFGPLTFDLEARADVTGFALTILRTHLAGIQLPQALAPRTQALASVDDSGRYRFDVTIALPLIGRLVRYRGWLMPT